MHPYLVRQNAWIKVQPDPKIVLLDTVGDFLHHPTLSAKARTETLDWLEKAHSHIEHTSDPVDILALLEAGALLPPLDGCMLYEARKGYAISELKAVFGKLSKAAQSRWTALTDMLSQVDTLLATFDPELINTLKFVTEKHAKSTSHLS